MKSQTLKIVLILIGILVSLVFIGNDIYEKEEGINFQAQLQQEGQTWNDFMQNPNATNPVEIWTPSGEFFKALDIDSQSWDLKKRELLNGTLYWNTEFQTHQNNNIKLPFLFSNQENNEGGIQVGKLFIQNIKSNVLIQKQEHIISIVNEGHAIEIFFEGIREPFVLPSKMNILVNERFISDRSGMLFYSKLRKLLRLRSNDYEKELTQNIQDEKKSIEQRKKAVREFIENQEHPYLTQDELEIVQHIKSYQTNSIGLSEKDKNERAFQTLIQPLFKGLKSLREKDIITAEEYIKHFEESESQWKSLLEKGIQQEERWNQFFEIYTLWKYIQSPDQDAYFFFQTTLKNTPLEQMEIFWEETESHIKNKKWDHIEESLLGIQSILNNVPIWESDNHIFRITRMRRLLAETLKNEPILQTKKYFEIHQQLILEELKLETHLEKNQELKLENSKDIMVFIQSFLKTPPHESSFEVIMKTYRILKVDVIEKEINIEVFTPEEKEIIHFIKLLGNNTVDKESLERIQREQKANEIIRETGTSSQKESQSREKEGIQTEADLMYFLQTHGWKTTQAQKSTTSGSVPMTTFSHITKDKNQTLSGTFYYNNQVFHPLIENEVQKEIRGSKTIQVQVLTKLWSQEAPITTPKEEDALIPQETQQALIARYRAQKALSQIGLSVQKPNIKIQNIEMNTFLIQDIAFNENTQISFVYESVTEKIHTIEIKQNQKKHTIKNTIEIEDLNRKVENILSQWK